jgi:hypothetical protein
VKLGTSPVGIVKLFFAAGLEIQASDNGAGFSVAGRVFREDGGTTTITDTTVLTLGTWYDLLLAHDVSTGEITLAVDGSLAETGAYSGARRALLSGWTMQLPDDSVASNAAVWEGFLAPTASYLDLLVDQGFGHYWSLQTQRNSGANEPDLIGTRTLTMSGGNTVNNSAGPLGASDGSNAQTFAESDTEAMVNGITSWPIDSDWSVSLWVKMTVQTGANNIIAAWDQTATRYLYLIRRDDRSGLCLQIGDGITTYFINFGQEIENDGAWHHVVVTRDYSATATADTWKLYLDNVLKTTTTRSAVGHSTIATANLFAIGNRYAENVGMNGSIAHVAFAFGVVIGASDVAAQWGYRDF